MAVIFNCCECFFLPWVAPALISHLKNTVDENCDMQGLMIHTDGIPCPFMLVVDRIHKLFASSSKEIKARYTNFDDIFKAYGTSS